MDSQPLRRKNPFVGPRALQTGEPLYGRDREIAQAASLLLAERIVLLYSPSGAGKSSLIHAGLIPRLAARKFHVLPTIRINLEPPPKLVGHSGFNRYVFSALSSLEEGRPAEDRRSEAELANLKLSDYLDPIPAPAVLLILDQFEEILTIHPTDQAAKQVFFQQLGQLLSVPNRWALLAMREDYIAALEPYLLPIPARLKSTYRLDLLGKEAAQRVMQKTARQEEVEFGEAAADKLIDDLSRIQVQLPDGSFEEQPGLYVEPVQLQVVCYNLWEKLDPQDQDITLAEVESIGDVVTSLSNYYAHQVTATAAQTGVQERAIRDWCEQALITKSGVRSQVLMGNQRSQGLENEAIQQLENAHLVRRDTRRGATWFELSHDRLIEPVRSNNQVWFQTHLSLLQRRAALWGAEHRPENLLLREAELEQAQTWAAEYAQEMSELDLEFLQASQAAQQRAEEARLRQEQAIKLQEQQRQASRLRRLLFFALAAALAAAAFGAIAFQARSEAVSGANLNATLAVESQKNAATANVASTQASFNEADARANARTATAALATAFVDRGTAEAASGTAIAAQATAVFNADYASQQAALATSRRLASQAGGYLETQPDLTALLGVEAWQSADTVEARSVLLERLQFALGQTILPLGETIPDQSSNILSLAVSPDGHYLAWGEQDGSVVLWSIQERTPTALDGHTGPVNSVAFNFNGTVLASGGSDSRLILWPLDDLRPTELPGIAGQVTALAFHPSNQTLAATIGSTIYTWNVHRCLFFEDCESPGPPVGSHRAVINSLAWSPDGRRIASGSGDLEVIIWDAENGGRLLSHRRHQDNVSSVAWSPQGDLVASGDWDGEIILWDVARDQFIGQPLKPHGDHSIFGLAISSDGRILASGSGIRDIRLIDLQTREEVGALLEVFDFRTSALAFSPIPGDRRLAAGAFGGSLRLYDVPLQQPLKDPILSLEGEILRVTSLPPAGSILMAVAVGEQVELWNLGQSMSEPLHRLSLAATGAAFSPDGKTLALSDADLNIHLIEVATGNELDTRFAFPGDLNMTGLVFTPEGTLISVQCFGTATLQIPLEGERQLCIAFTVSIWDIGLRELSREFHIGVGLDEFVPTIGSIPMAVDPSSTILAISGDNRISIWNLDDGSAAGITLERHASAVSSLAFSPDGRFLASGGVDRSLILWSIETYQNIGDGLVGSSGVVTSLAFGPQGKMLLAGEACGQLVAWTVDIEEWIARACTLTDRNLTQGEWQQFFPDQPDDYRKTCP